ncbi:hypothetical protein D3C78_1330630 [compost metagenome]
MKPGKGLTGSSSMPAPCCSGALGKAPGFSDSQRPCSDSPEVNLSVRVSAASAATAAGSHSTPAAAQSGGRGMRHCSTR